MALSDNCEAYWALTTSSLTDAINSHVLTATNVSFESGAPGPCRRVDNSGASILRCSTITLTEPFTMAAQVYVNGGASGDMTFMAYARDGTNYFQTYQSASSNNHLVRSRAGGTAGDANGGGVSGGGFNNCAGVWTGSTSRQSYLAGTLSAANTTSVAPSGSGTHTALGAIWDGSSILIGADALWRFKEFAVWSRALSDAELDSYFSDPSQVLGVPVLSSPSGTVTSNTAATITATTDKASTGSMYFLRRTGGAAAAAATIIATGETQATGANPQSKSVTLLGGTANQYVDIVQTGPSNVVTAGPLTTVTTVSAPTGTTTGSTTATAGFTTDRAVSAGFPAYFLTLPAATAAPANAAALIAAGGVVSQTTGGTTPTRSITGLTASTAYRTHMCQPGSNVVSSASYTTDASGPPPPPPPPAPSTSLVLGVDLSGNLVIVG
jgi:hypothetical protein